MERGNRRLCSTDGAIEPVRQPPPQAIQGPACGRSASPTDASSFTATLTATHAGTGWTGQDWLVVPADASPWALPRIRPTDPAVQWYAGQAQPRPESITRRYVYDPQAVTLRLQDAPADAVDLDSSGEPLEPGIWILAVRLQSAYRLAGFIPVAKVVVSQTGDVSYEAYTGEYGVQPSPRPSEP